MAIVKMQEIIDVMERFAPLELAGDYDNVGLIVGRRDAVVAKVLLALDATNAVIEEAKELGCEAIITHHPPIWTAIKHIRDDNPLGVRLLSLIESGIAVYSAHTNLDACKGGINDILFGIIGLQNKQFFHTDGKPSVFFGRVGTVSQEMSLSNYANLIKEKLGLPFANFVGEPNAVVRKVGIIAGSAAREQEFKSAIAVGCDTYITSDIKYDGALLAQDLGLNLVDATHYGSEVVFTNGIAPYLRKELPKIEFMVSKIYGQPFKAANGGQ
ncbi:MAG: Nif3-like dinuclear metal center hexameric protein [Defluviitaleaceae bacterium]|nr:Nif3-like dinuclear metal center hexameric protein [Defluviitaleaceae bacterium]